MVARPARRARGYGMVVGEVLTEVGSGTDGHRRRLARLLADATAATVVAEHRDRLGAFRCDKHDIGPAALKQA